MSRFSNALLGALALHALLLLARTRHVPERSLQRTSAPLEQLVEVDEAAVVEAAREVAPASDRPQPTAGVAKAAPEAGAVRAPSPVPETSEASGAEAAPAADALSSSGSASPASSAEAMTDKPPRKIDLGLDGKFFMGPPSEELPRVHKSEFQRQLEASLSADDVRRGLARGNALLGSLNAAVRDTGPVRGEALLRVTVGADGSMTDVEFLRGSAADWSGALASFRALAARKRVRVPPGARGLRVTFSVKAKVQRPSGKEVDASGLDVPSLAPNGFTLHGTYDVADLAAGPQRLVYARVVSEEVL